MINTDPSDDLARAVAALPAELALAFLAITRALRPRTRMDRMEFDRQIRRAVRKTPPQKTMTLAILQQALKK